MSKRLAPRDDRVDPGPGLDLLRSLAGYPHCSVQMNKHGIQSRILIIQRDHNGDVVSSTERIEESEYTDLFGEWLD